MPDTDKSEAIYGDYFFFLAHIAALSEQIIGRLLGAFGCESSVGT